MEIQLLKLLLLLSRVSRVRLCDPTDGSPPGPSVPGILQARTLEWVAISFSQAPKCFQSRTSTPAQLNLREPQHRQDSCSG